ncbi:MAG: hypothetical protein JST01_15390 [Cyanobacteria bacterium SZAS TMP-1]|nr:hypothetical protein [Cyanobacteria bacterium SZAS TMP-1]
MPKEIAHILIKGQDTAGISLQESISAYRQAAEELSLIIDSKSAMMGEADPFRELKTFQNSLPLRIVQSKLAHLLRRKWAEQQDDKLLTEGLGLLKNLVSRDRVIADGECLMLTLMDLWRDSDADLAELEELSASMPKSTTTLYSRALISFRKYGPTPASRKAMKAALKQDPFVPAAIVAPVEENELPKRILQGTRTDAASYALDAGHQWRTAPGALLFMSKVFGVKLPGLAPDMNQEREVARSVKRQPVLLS